MQLHKEKEEDSLQERQSKHFFQKIRMNKYLQTLTIQYSCCSMYIISLLGYLKGVKLPNLIQFGLVLLLLLLSVNEAVYINIILGVFIPMVQHFNSFKRMFDSPSNSESSSPIAQSSPQSLSPSTSPTSSNSIQSPLKSYSPQQQATEEAQQASEKQGERNTSELKNSQQQFFSSHKLQSSQENVIFYKNSSLSIINEQSYQRNNQASDNNYNGIKEYFINQTKSHSASSQSSDRSNKSFLTYWLLYCVLLFLESQFVPQDILNIYKYQVIKCFIILFLREFSISLFLEVVYLIIGKDNGNSTDPLKVHIQNQNVMKKIDEQIKRYYPKSMNYSMLMKMSIR